jgi:GNAT superfamily N-acetyltransferase
MNNSPNEPVIYADGSVGFVRQAVATDRPAVAAMYNGASEESRYTRFFTLGRQAVEGHLDRLFGPESRSIAFIALRSGRVVGIVDIEPEGSGEAEIAFMVGEGVHGIGVGTLLLERAVEYAEKSGVVTLVADVLAINHAMLEVFRESGFAVALSAARDTVSVRFDPTLTSGAFAAERHRHDLALAARNQAVATAGIH